jgi:plasmid stabilization system protein ParE
VSRTLIISPEAEQDLADAKRWYDDRRYGLGAERVECVEEAIDTVRRLPLVPAVVFEGLRRVLVRRFPYAVFYRVADDRITVVAVYHTSRDPRGWQERA